MAGPGPRCGADAFCFPFPFSLQIGEKYCSAHGKWRYRARKRFGRVVGVSHPLHELEARSPADDSTECFSRTD
jgi:hypothetical protein